jgi:hypothetical protein
MNSIQKLSFFAFIIICMAGTGCSSLHKEKDSYANLAAESAAHHWYLDPSTEMSSYKTYAFLQVTAVRYQDEIFDKKKKTKGFFGLFKQEKKEPKRPVIHHTDELIWRVIADEMAKKGYAQVAPVDADLLVIYYGGPRPQQPPQGVMLKPNTFDAYFVANELKPQTFFVDIIDAKAQMLVYRGWNNSTFSQQNPEPNRVVEATKHTVQEFPAVR